MLEVWELQIWKLVGSFWKKDFTFLNGLLRIIWKDSSFWNIFFVEGIWIDNGMKGEQSICNLGWLFLKSDYLQGFYASHVVV